MKCPRYIKLAIQRRRNAARQFLINDTTITVWCEKNGIKTEYIGGNIECIADPELSTNQILKDIENAREEEKK